MGCCLSRNTSTSTPKPLTNPRLRLQPPLEEETVKEVLTETPFPESPPLVNNSNNKAVAKKRNEADLKIVEEAVVEIEQEVKVKKSDGFEIEIQKSVDIETSEITVASENRSAAVAVAVAVAESLSVSVSESVSIGGVEKRGRGGGGGGGGEEVMSKSRDRAADFSRRQRSTCDQSPARVLKRRPYSGEQTINGVRDKRVRSPAKRTVPGPAPSPEKKKNTNTHLASRAARGRSQSPATSNPRSGITSGPGRLRRDSGERSGRRSRSPATVNRGRALTEVNTKVNDGQPNQDEGRRTGTVHEEEDEAGHRARADESLDNPLVSLECFIFL